MESRFSRLEALFQAARRLPAAERTPFLERECADDVALADEVTGLLRQLDAAGHDRPAALRGLAAEVVTAADEVPSSFGEFRIVRPIAAGGMGVVYEAEQADPPRRVALKVLHPGAASPEGRRRFAREAEILGRLHHAGIARIHAFRVLKTDAGERPYLAMELVDGVPLNVHARELDTRARLALLAKVCDAVGHAHANGVIHRDLKPSNILVTRAGEPRVLDFGVARLLDGESTLRTRTGQVIGTVAYMSPEQATGDLERVDTRADVYSLGVLAFEILCGRLPHDVTGAPLPAAIRRVVEEDPPTPETLVPALRGDVSLILQKAMSKEPARRYAEAGALAEDLRRHLAHEPILARPTTITYQLRKFVRRHRALVVGTAATLVALVVGLVLALKSAGEEQRHRLLAEASAREAHWARSQTLIESASADLRAFAGPLARRRLAAVPPEHRGWAWRHLVARCDTSTWGAPLDVAGTPSFALRADGGQVAVLDARGPALLDLRTRARFRPTLPDLDWQAVCYLGTVPLAVGLRGARLGWTRLDTGETTYAALKDPVRVSGAAGSEDGTTLGIALDSSAAQAAWVLDARTGVGIGVLAQSRPSLYQVGIRRDGSLLAFAEWGQDVALVDGRTGARTRTLVGHLNVVQCLAFSPDGRLLATGGDDKTVILWRVEDGALLHRLAGHDGDVFAVAWSPDGTRLASGDAHGCIRLWDVGSGTLDRVLLGHEARLGALAFPDGPTLVSAAPDGTRTWDAAPGSDPDVLLHHAGRAEGNPYPYVYAVAYAPDGSLLASAGWDDTVRLSDPATGDLLATLRVLPNTQVYDVAIGAGGRRILAGARRRCVWDADTGRRLHDVKPGFRDEAYAASPDGRSFLLADHNVLRRLDAASFALDGHWAVDSATLLACAWSPDGTRAATVSRTGVCLVRAMPGGEVLHRVDAHAGEALCVAFDRNGERLATGGADHAVRVWDVRTGRRLHELSGHIGVVYAVAWHPTEPLLASGARDNTVRLWDMARGTESVDLRGHADYVHGLAFSPDGTTLASASGDNTVRLWTTLPMRERRAAAEAARAARAAAAGRVDALLASLGDPAAVAAALRADAGLSPQDRRAALHVVLMRAAAAGDR